MKAFLTVLKWILIILFFPMSLIFVAYYKQREARKTYFEEEE